MSTALFIESSASSGPGNPRWSPATRFIFRAWLVLVVLLVLPRSIEFFVNTGIWPFIANWLGRWPITHILQRAEHQVAGPMTGADFLPDFIAAGAIGCLSLLVAIVWSLTPVGRRDHPGLFVWLYTVVRFMLGSLLLYYAWDKILPG